MKNSLLIIMITIFALAGFASDAKADEKYVQSAGSSVFTIDRDAGTITRLIRGNSQGSISQYETLSCKYGYIVTINGDATAMLDLLAPANSALALKRVEWARKDCQLYNVEPRF